jgi:hypothetical protein
MSNASTPLAHPAPEYGARLIKLDSSDGYITIINTHTVAAERAEALPDLRIRATAETIRYVQRFPSANFHVNLDHTPVVNYASGRAVRRSRPRVSTPKLRRSYARPPRSRMGSCRSSMSCCNPWPRAARDARLVSFMSVGQTVTENC